MAVGHNTFYTAFIPALWTYKIKDERIFYILLQLITLPPLLPSLSLCRMGFLFWPNPPRTKKCTEVASSRRLECHGDPTVWKRQRVREPFRNYFLKKLGLYTGLCLLICGFLSFIVMITIIITTCTASKGMISIWYLVLVAQTVTQASWGGNEGG